MQDYDAAAFADWLELAFQQSAFKSYSALADAAKVTRATVSALAKAREQSLTGKASRPKAETVIKLAEVLKKDVDEALMLAGHAPKNVQIVPKPILDAIARSGTLDEEDSILIAGIIDQIEKRNKEKNQ